jgi:hypothetical protein
MWSQIPYVLSMRENSGAVLRFSDGNTGSIKVLQLLVIKSGTNTVQALEGMDIMELAAHK